jgi:hypothetical protein
MVQAHFTNFVYAMLVDRKIIRALRAAPDGRTPDYAALRQEFLDLFKEEYPRHWVTGMGHLYTDKAMRYAHLLCD